MPTETIPLNGAFPFELTLESAELTSDYGRRRAPEGSHFVVVKMRAVATDGNSWMDENVLQLVVDGVPRPAIIQVPVDALGVKRGGADDLTEVYELPDDYETVSLLAVSENPPPPDRPLSIKVPPLPED